MESNDLRLGNLIINIDGNIGKVTSISDRTIKVDYEDVGFSNLSLKPILLSEEWFYKFNFTLDLDGYTYKRFRFNIYQPVNWSGYCFCESNSILKEIKYVHELQNLYFALNGTELNYE